MKRENIECRWCGKEIEYCQYRACNGCKDYEGIINNMARDLLEVSIFINAKNDGDFKSRSYSDCLDDAAGLYKEIVCWWKQNKDKLVTSPKDENGNKLCFWCGKNANVYKKHLCNECVDYVVRVNKFAWISYVSLYKGGYKKPTQIYTFFLETAKGLYSERLSWFERLNGNNEDSGALLFVSRLRGMSNESHT